jgi:hypothetical protein
MFRGGADGTGAKKLSTTKVKLIPKDTVF